MDVSTSKSVVEPTIVTPNPSVEQNHLSPCLPDEPLVRIRPGKSWAVVDFRELWVHRELFYFLVWRDLKVRYKQTVLGVAWAIIQPLFTMLIFTLFFGRLAGVPSDGVPYPVFVYAGLLLWTFFSNAVTASGNSLVGNSNLLSKVYFPRLFIPSATVGAALVDLSIAFVILVGLMIYYSVAVTWTILMLPVLVLLTTLLAVAIGTWLAALNVKYRDIRFALPFLIQVWMFVSPIIYPPSFVPEKWRWLLALNPLTGIIDSFRVSLFGHQQFNWGMLAVSTVMTLALLAYSAYVFWRMEENFADIV
jgi:lipopolysaccharide transport system permease protein